MSITTRPAAKQLVQKYLNVRRFSDLLSEPLTAEDCMIQSMDDASPVRWHLAHTTWFFETFVLSKEADYQPLNEQYRYLFNSYYNAIGSQFPRPHRGVISRPGLADVKAYRQYVDQEMLKRLESPEFVDRMHGVIEVGLHHEQQHQELILTDIKHAFSCNPLLPAYNDRAFDTTREPSAGWIEIAADKYEMGHVESGFCFDNELPVHSVYCESFAIAKDLVTCGQYIEFIENDGYQRPEFWLSLGWQKVTDASWDAPLYWVKQDGKWMQFTMAGLVEINPNWPLCHVSYFEADAFARWSGKRLPTEFEWEVAWRQSLGGTTPESDEPLADYLFENELAVHPTRSPRGFIGGVWQWTSSSYQAYPGYAPPAGAIGEYNGKFMCNQYVLRGGSVATSHSHIRGTYRNFFPAEMRWQFAGVRLAR